MAFAIMAVLCSVTLTGCFLFGKKKKDPDNTGVTQQTNGTVTEKPAATGTVTESPAATGYTSEQTFTDPGRLIGVHYESSAGSMEYHSEFEIDVNENEIAYLSYYGDYYFNDAEYELGEKKLAELDSIGRVGDNADIANDDDDFRYNDPVERKNVPLDRDLWNVLAEEFGYLKVKLAEMPELSKEDVAKGDSELHVLDGGDYSILHLTWEKDGNTRTAQYRTPGGKRWSTIIETLHEMARPVGRDLRRIGETVMVNMYLKTPDYSYQITPVDKDQEKYYFFVHDDKGKDSRLTRNQWYVVRDHLSAMDLSGFDQGGYNDSRYLKLEYNDGEYIYYLIDKKTADELREYLIGLGY